MSNYITIMDVAKRAGVSKSTVSDALNLRRSTSVATRKKVQEAAKLLGYKPNYAAQSLSTKKTMMIGLLVSDLHDVFTAALVECFGNELANSSYEILLGLVQHQQQLAIDYLSKFSSGMVDGIINLVPQLSADDARFASHGLPIVTYLRREPDCPAYLDFIPGTMDALGHLWGLGHRRIGFLAEHERAREVGEDGRILGYRQFFSLRQTEIDENMIMFVENPCTPNDLSNKIQLLYDRGATAIFAGNDAKALAVLQWAYRKGIRVPEELSVIGFNDGPDAITAIPPLTTVQIPVKPIVAATVGALMAAIEKRPAPQQQVIVPHLIIRQSTGKAKYA